MFLFLLLMVDQELKVSDTLVPSNNPPSDNSAQSNGSGAPCRTTKIRFLDQLSPEAQKAYHDEQERKKEEKKSKIEEIGEKKKWRKDASLISMLGGNLPPIMIKLQNAPLGVL